MKRKSLFALALFSLLTGSLLVACAGATPLPTFTLTPTTSPLPATATSTPAPPTPTSTPLPPTDTPTPLPPIPTADFTLNDIVGIWTRLDADRGQLYLQFFESGSYIAAHGTVEGFVRSGKFELDGAAFTFLTWDDCPPGRYVLRLRNEGNALFFDLLDDPACPDRSEGIARRRWDRFAPTPTPNP